jgi:hypothetical protein
LTVGIVLVFVYCYKSACILLVFNREYRHNHWLAVYAVFSDELKGDKKSTNPKKQRKVLIGFLPMLDLNIRHLDATAHKDVLEKMLQSVGKSLVNVLFIIGIIYKRMLVCINFLLLYTQVTTLQSILRFPVCVIVTLLVVPHIVSIYGSKVYWNVMNQIC